MLDPQRDFIMGMAEWRWRDAAIALSHIYVALGGHPIEDTAALGESLRRYAACTSCYPFGWGYRSGNVFLNVSMGGAYDNPSIRVVPVEEDWHRYRELGYSTRGWLYTEAVQNPIITQPMLPLPRLPMMQVTPQTRGLQFIGLFLFLLITLAFIGAWKIAVGILLGYIVIARLIRPQWRRFRKRY